MFNSSRSSPSLRGTTGTALRRVKPKKVSFDGKPLSNVKGAVNVSGSAPIGKFSVSDI